MATAVELAFEGEVVELGRSLVGFEFDEGDDAGEEVVTLSVRPFGRGFGE